MLKMSRSEYYRRPKQTEREEMEQEEAVIHCFWKNDRNSGRIRIRRELLNQGIEVSEYRIAKILKKNGLTAKSGRTGKAKRKKPTEEQYIEENLIVDKFSVQQVNALWCSDITELKCAQGKVFLCGTIDVASRRIVGLTIGRSQTQKLVQDCIQMAAGRFPQRPAGAIFHSDRGCQYTAKKTKELVERLGFRKSMSRPGTPSDNQPIESFWRTLAVELPDIRKMSFREASLTILAYVYLYYNAQRLHSGIHYLTPNQFFTLSPVHDS